MQLEPVKFECSKYSFYAFQEVNNYVAEEAGGQSQPSRSTTSNTILRICISNKSACWVIVHASVAVC